jgi:Uma2 family endonuclease
MSTASRPMTLEEFLKLPDDGVERSVIRGELRERPMTTRGGPHCIVMGNLARLIGNWVCARPRPRGRLYTGDARVRIRRDPETIVGADLLYLDPDQAARNRPTATTIDEPPTLVIEILSPSDTIEAIDEKIQEYLDAGVPHVWIVNPRPETVTVHRPGTPPVLFNNRQEVAAEPELPGLRIAVAEMFEG